MDVCFAPSLKERELVLEFNNGWEYYIKYSHNWKLSFCLISVMRITCLNLQAFFINSTAFEDKHCDRFGPKWLACVIAAGVTQLAFWLELSKELAGFVVRLIPDSIVIFRF